MIPHRVQVFPTSNANYEVALIKNGSLTGANYNTSDFAHVDFDVSATAISGGTIVQNGYTASSNQSRSESNSDIGYNFDLQLGVTLADVSDVYTVAVRTLSGTGAAFGSLSFYDLTD